MRVHDDELDIDEPLVRGLLAEQFPEWARLPLARVEPEGTVNVIYRLGTDKSLRLPRIDWAAEEMEPSPVRSPRPAATKALMSGRMVRRAGCWRTPARALTPELTFRLFSKVAPCVTWVSSW